MLTTVTYPWSLAALPALALPCGLSREGLPIGLQLVGPPRSDGLLLDVGEEYQRATDWHLRTPSLEADVVAAG